ncbi:hypothetical protein CEE45_11845 [Candidatus Heimdallarchaeota archaeon B3_Heim]|nr:MAG: hypothetical protein CEE45_11845 [Candidatus Heimdallarchaeota archaeon B3_Heim]
MIIAAFIFLGIGNGLTGPPAMALVGDIISKDENAVGMGFFNLLGNFGIITGPLIGGILVTYTDIIGTFFVAGLIELFSLLAILILMSLVFKEKPHKMNL